MRGVENIIRMRKAGRKPSVVWVEMMPMQQWTRYLTEKADRHVDIHMTDRDIASVDFADLRCLSGISNVLVQGPNNSTTERVARACFKAGAKVVQAYWFDVTNPYQIKVVKALRLSEEGEKVVWQQ